MMPLRSASVLCALTLLACGKTSGSAPPPPPLEAAAMNTLTAQERADGWRLLFDGQTTNGWRGYRRPDMPNGWKVADSTLTKDVASGDIITADGFGDFELQLEWKIAAGGNAGLFYRATEEYERIYWSAPEYQLLDDANAPDGQSRLTAAGAAYALYPASAGIVRPAGEWNTTRVILRGAHVEHWLNGRKVLEYELWSPDWEAKVKATKFASWPNYGRAKEGHIGIQGDHEGVLALRNIKIRSQ
jgi:hypothetical protein